MDVHMLTAIGARRHMFAHGEVPAKLKVLSLLTWACGFEITTFAKWAIPREEGAMKNTLFGATRVPGNLEALLAGAECEGKDKPPMTTSAAELLDYISQKITIRPQVQLSKFDEKTMVSHDDQMRLLYGGKVSVAQVLTTEEVATKVFPAVYLYAQRFSEQSDLE